VKISLCNKVAVTKMGGMFFFTHSVVLSVTAIGLRIRVILLLILVTANNNKLTFALTLTIVSLQIYKILRRT